MKYKASKIAHAEYLDNLDCIVASKDDEFVVVSSLPNSRISTIVRYSVDGQPLNSYSLIAEEIIKLIYNKGFVYLLAATSDSDSQLQILKFNSDLNHLNTVIHSDTVDALDIYDAEIIGDTLCLVLSVEDNLILNMTHMPSGYCVERIIGDEIVELIDKLFIKNMNGQLLLTMIEDDSDGNNVCVNCKMYDMELHELDIRVDSRFPYQLFNILKCFDGDYCIEDPRHSRLVDIFSSYGESMLASLVSKIIAKDGATISSLDSDLIVADNLDVNKVIVRRYDSTLKRIAKVKIKCDDNAVPRLITKDNIIISDDSRWYLIKHNSLSGAINNE